MMTEETHIAETNTHYGQRQLLIIILLILYLLVALKSAWIAHDAYITYRTVENFIHGYGLVWNAGERVQAFTHPLWMFALSGGRLITGEMYYSVFFLSYGFSLISLLLFANKIARSTMGALLGLFILLCSKSYIDYTTSGLENPLSHLLIALYFFVYCTIQTASKRHLLLAFLAALCALNRIDLLIFLAPTLGYELWQRRSWSTLMLYLIGFMPLMAWELFSIFYYGFPFPNTAYAKLNTGIPKTALLIQGVFYLLREVDIDPLTFVSIGGALGLPFITRTRTDRLIAFSIALYLLYVIQIGGDFMAGRYFTVPLLGAVFMFSRLQFPSWQSPACYALLAGVVGISLLNPATSPLLSDDQYKTDANENQIEDMRAHHDYHTSLLNATPENRLYEQGYIKGADNRKLYRHCLGMGPTEYAAGPQPYVVDECALTDALLARIPAIYNPDIFAGHYGRYLPDGYWDTLLSGKNQIVDSNLATYYDALMLITRGDLWSRKRLETIWQMNMGHYNHLVDFNRYRYPDVATVQLEEMSRWQEDETLKEDIDYIRQNQAITPRGWQLLLPEVIHAPFIELGWTYHTYYQVTYNLGNTLVAQQTVGLNRITLDEKAFTIVAIPPIAQEQGYDNVRFLPLAPGHGTLSYVEIIDPTALSEDTFSTPEFNNLLHLYHFAYQRYLEPMQSEILAQTQAALKMANEEHWDQLSPSALVALLETPDPAIRDLLYAHIGEQSILADETGTSLFRYITPIVASTQIGEDSQGLNLHLYFRVLSQPRHEYSAWFSIDSTTDDRKYMIYDRFPHQPTTRWRQGQLIDFVADIRLDPGTYNIDFGFWRPNIRDRLYIQESDTYWLNLGIHEVDEIDEEKQEEHMP